MKPEEATKLILLSRLGENCEEGIGSDGWNRTTDLGVMNPTL